MSRCEPLAPDRLVAQLELERRQDRDQVGVAAALAVAVHRALHEPRARLHRHERVRHAAAGVVVRVDAHLDESPSSAHHSRRGLGHLRRQRRAVRVAERHVLGPRLGRGAEAAERVVGVVAEGVEEVLGVVDHALALPGEEGHRVGDHAQVLLGVHLRDLLEVERPRLPHERADGREAVGEQAQRRRPPRRPASRRRVMPKAATSAVSKRLLREQLEERLLLGVRGREAGLDQVHAERVERVRHAHLLVHRERHALALHPVAQGRVIDDDPGHAWDGTGTRSSQSA